VNDRDWIRDLSNYLRQSFVRLCEVLGQPRSISELRSNPPLAIEEAKSFLLGLESGVFHFDENARVQSESLPYPSKDNPGVELCQIFALNPPPPRIVRESICQLATASSLVLERGWMPGQVKMGTVDPLEYGVDMIVESAAGELLVGVEVKRSVHELQKFTNDFRQCCKRGAHAKAECAFQQNHQMHEYCVRYKPTFLWIVAPGSDVCFKLSYADRHIELEELETLPRRSHIEFGLSQGSAGNQ
jgi:hypothetical protein